MLRCYRREGLLYGERHRSDLCCARGQAIMESQSNPMAIMNYQDDPDVMLVFEKMAKLFPQTAEAPGPQ